MNANRHPSLTYRFLLLIAGVMVFSLVGYGGYVLYRRFDYPAQASVGLMVLAVMAGVASLFSPCSFPLLVTLLSHEATSRDSNVPSKSHPLHFAATFSLGVMAFLLIVGSALVLGAAPLMEQVTFTSPTGRLIRLLAGLVLVGFGWWQLQGRSLNFIWINALLQPLWRTEERLRRQRTTMNYGLYGFGYILAGFG